MQSSELSHWWFFFQLFAQPWAMEDVHPTSAAVADNPGVTGIGRCLFRRKDCRRKMSLLLLVLGLVKGDPIVGMMWHVGGKLKDVANESYETICTKDVLLLFSHCQRRCGFAVVWECMLMLLHAYFKVIAAIRSRFQDNSQIRGVCFHCCTALYLLYFFHQQFNFILN